MNEFSLCRRQRPVDLRRKDLFLVGLPQKKKKKNYEMQISNLIFINFIFPSFISVLVPVGDRIDPDVHWKQICRFRSDCFRTWVVSLGGRVDNKTRITRLTIRCQFFSAISLGSIALMDVIDDWSDESESALSLPPICYKSPKIQHPQFSGFRLC